MRQSTASRAAFLLYLPLLLARSAFDLRLPALVAQREAFARRQVEHRPAVVTDMAARSIAFLFHHCPPGGRGARSAACRALAAAEAQSAGSPEEGREPPHRNLQPARSLSRRLTCPVRAPSQQKSSGHTTAWKAVTRQLVGGPRAPGPGSHRFARIRGRRVRRQNPIFTVGIDPRPNNP